ncbi:hypothetical protein D918_01101 [Trichuris suis]|nr:hypothetical protein D918_01101 [Trichuris suis]
MEMAAPEERQLVEVCDYGRTHVQLQYVFLRRKMNESEYVNNANPYGYYGAMPMEMAAGMVRIPAPRFGHQGPVQMMYPPMGGQPPGGLLPHPVVNFNMPRLAYRFKAQPPPPPLEPDCYGRRMRRSASQARKQVDVTSSILNYIERRLWDDPARHGSFVTQPHILFAPDTFPIRCFGETSAECVMTRLIRSAVNKIKCPIFDLCVRHFRLTYILALHLPKACKCTRAFFGRRHIVNCAVL